MQKVELDNINMHNRFIGSATSLKSLWTKPNIITIIAVALSYNLVDQLGDVTASIPGYITPIFSSAGLALAAVLLYKRPALLGVGLGSIFGNIISIINEPSSPNILMNIWIALVIAFGVTASAGISATLVRQLCKNQSPLYSVRNILVLIIIGVVGGSLISPTINAINLCFCHIIPWDLFGHLWINWWIGNAAGVYIATPLILVWFQKSHFHLTRWRIMEITALEGIILLLSFFIFFRNVSLEYCLLPLLIWVTYRFSMRETLTTAAAIAILATIGTANGTSPLVRVSMNETFLHLHFFLIITILCALILAGLLAERKRVKMELIIAKEKAEESNQLKTAFLQNISHEIRTPLNAIVGFSGLLSDYDVSEENQKKYISIIQKNSDQLLSIVSDILTISTLETKQETINIQKTNINNILVDLLATFKQQASSNNIFLSIKLELTEQQAEVYTDKIKLTQTLINLISNALKFTAKGYVEFGYHLREAELEFYVKDTGIGIRPDVCEKIFEHFQHADESIHVNYGGTGLGLSISKGFIELLGGRFWVESEQYKGSIFYFTIPYNPVYEIE